MGVQPGSLGCSVKAQPGKRNQDGILARATTDGQLQRALIAHSTRSTSLQVPVCRFCPSARSALQQPRYSRSLPLLASWVRFPSFYSLVGSSALSTSTRQITCPPPICESVESRGQFIAPSTPNPAAPTLPSY